MCCQRVNVTKKITRGKMVRDVKRKAEVVETAYKKKKPERIKFR